MLYYERKLKKRGYNIIIGVDEVGRGSLAGPVVAAAVVLKKVYFKNRIDDSKKLTPSQREKAFPEIVDNSIYGIGIINEKIIDRLNIAVATRLAMGKAVAALLKKLANNYSQQQVHILVDGEVKLDTGLACTSIIKGDAKSKSIACASILAKVTRDKMMSLYAKTYPQYGLKQHKGYGTKLHRDAIKKFGYSDIHRKTFSCA